MIYELVLKNYVENLNDDELKFLHQRFEQNFSGDLAEALETIQENEELNTWLSSAKNHDEFNCFLDILFGFLDNQVKLRQSQQS
jgi:hypothetical protein